jgi:prepilin-type N-terminal cleavage/methylation domain-containing protein
MIVSDRTNKSRQLSPGFTLVELLAVIAIIAVLLALSVPMLGKARKSSLAAADLASLRRIGQAMQGYAADNTNIINQTSTSSPQDVWPDLFWVRASPYLGMSLAENGTLTTLQLQQAANKFNNKTLASIDKRYVGTFAGAIQPFAFNVRLFNYHAPPVGGGKSTDHFRKLTEFPSLASTPYIAVGRWSFASGVSSPLPNPASPGNGVLWPYAKQQTIVVYLDGHAAFRGEEITEEDCWGGIAH